ncbi:MAG TPA: arginase, partial [Burkholderiales bacterium]|nr:arginase [Burkholderiales bacterium]
MKKIVLIGAAGGYGAQNHSCQDGPEVIRSFDFLEQIEDSGIPYHWDGIVHLGREKGKDALSAVSEMCGLIAKKTEKAIREGDFPIVLGGDHSCAIGTWSGVKSAIEGRLGLIWIDAHMDSNTFETSPSRAIHGMPLACLLGRGEEQLTHIATRAPKLSPEDICLIGVRSFEEEEARLLKALGVRIYFMDEIRRRGAREVLKEALFIVKRETAGFGISIDLDALEPTEEPGVGSPVPDGMLKDELAEALAPLRSDSKFLALEIVEYNPYLDRNFTTARAVSDLIEAIAGNPL